MTGVGGDTVIQFGKNSDVVFYATINKWKGVFESEDIGGDEESKWCTKLKMRNMHNIGKMFLHCSNGYILKCLVKSSLDWGANGQILIFGTQIKPAR